MKLRRFLAGLLVFLSLFCWNAEILQPTCFTTACAEKIIVNGAEVAAYVTSSSANIRKKATTSSDIVTTLKRGTKLYVTDSVETAKGTWYKIRTENGKKFTVKAEGNSERNIYIQSAELNGKPYPYAYIRHSDIVKGGTLRLTMGPQPNREFGAAPEHRPFER